MNKLLRLSIFLLISSLSVSSFAQRSWTSKKKEDGVEVFVKDQSNAVIKQYKAEAETSATIDECVKFLMDLENHVNWSYTVIEVELLPSKTDKLLSYMVMDAPWPVEDRDIVIAVGEKKLANNKVQVSLTAIEGVKDEVDGRVRITESVTSWTFERVGNTTEIVYQGMTDPAGKVPDWLINAGLVDGPFETIKNFIENVEA